MSARDLIDASSLAARAAGSIRRVTKFNEYDGTVTVSGDRRYPVKTFPSMILIPA
jgi:hypothetical protein